MGLTIASIQAKTGSRHSPVMVRCEIPYFTTVIFRVCVPPAAVSRYT